MENLRQINDINYIPIKGDNILLNNRYGYLLDNEFNQILWENNDVEDWIGGWLEFLNQGGVILLI